MQPCNRIYYSKIHWRLNMFRAAYRSSSWATEAANTVWSSWWWAVCRSKHAEPSINVGIINSITRLHLVGCFYWLVFKGRIKRDTFCSNIVLRKCKKVRRFILVFIDGTLAIKENLIHTVGSGGKPLSRHKRRQNNNQNTIYIKTTRKWRYWSNL